jgi:hypothetical protein
MFSTAGGPASFRRCILSFLVFPMSGSPCSIRMAKTRGYDAGKKIGGRRRHIAVDTDGWFLMINLSRWWLPRHEG